MFSHVFEQNGIADALGVPLIAAEAASEGFLVRRDRLAKVVQPAFAAHRHERHMNRHKAII